MRVRSKLFLAMGLLAMIVIITYFGTTQGYMRGLFQDYQTENWANKLQRVYVQNGNRWTNADWKRLSGEMEQDRTKAGQAALLSSDGTVLLRVGESPVDAIIHHGKKRSLTVSGTTIGTLYMKDWGSADFIGFKIYLLETMHEAGIRVAASTTVVSLLAGFLLTVVLTKPLRRIITAIGQIAGGKLDVHIPIATRDEFGKVAAALNDMSRRLLQTEEARKRLVADVAHELRTPLAVMQAKLELIQEIGREVPPETLLPLQDELIRLTRLVGDLQQLTLAESGNLTLNRTSVDLAGLLGRLATSFQTQADSLGIELVITLPSEQVQADIDPVRIRQVFDNLLINALAYTPEGGSVTVTLSAGHRRDGKTYVCVAVADTGNGIPEERLPYLFDRFYRVEEARSRHTGGMGLGLAIAKEYAQAHGGFLEVESRIGLGSVFTVYLPAARKE